PGLQMQHATVAQCGVPNAIADPVFRGLRGHCVLLGDLQFGPSDFVNPIVKQDDGTWGVGLTFTPNALPVFTQAIESLTPNAAPDPNPRLLFVFRGAAYRWTSLPEADATIFLITGNQKLAQSIAASLGG